jgi:DNA-binding GntR family transcriptional regulator
MWEAVHAHVLVARATHPLDRLMKTDREHSEIVAALRERDLPRLQAAVDYHLRQVIENVRRAAGAALAEPTTLQDGGSTG